MHRSTRPYFGWKEDNYIGNLIQRNTPHSDWSSFYAVCRILPLIQKLFDEQKYTRGDMTRSETFCKKLPELFPEEAPALLHGDLWQGNFLISDQGISVYDPAVYYGHREMEIGMTLLFGGFDRQFYNAYERIYPLAAGWEERIPVAQLYPVLVHAVLFGGPYVQKACSIIKRYV